MVLDLATDEAGQLLAALSSDTARDIILELHDQASTLSEVADAVGTSRQNAQYHVKQLQSVDAIRVVDTIYSEKGREMKVYAPTGEPLIIVSGEEDNGSQIRERVAQALAPIVAIGLISVAIQAVATTMGEADKSDSGTLLSGEGTETEVAEDGDMNVDLDAYVTTTGILDGDQIKLEEPMYIEVTSVSQTFFEAYPGLMFFLGAMTALVLILGIRRIRQR